MVQLKTTSSSCHQLIFSPCTPRLRAVNIQPGHVRHAKTRRVSFIVRAEAPAASSAVQNGAQQAEQAPGSPGGQDGAPKAVEDLPSGELQYKALSPGQKFATSLKLTTARPWRRFKKGSVLTLKIGGEIGDKPAGLLQQSYSFQQICQALQNAAYDPRVSGVYVQISPLAVGWARLQELRQYIDLFRQSGKFSMAYMITGGEKEYFLASSFGEIYLAPSASFQLRGIAVSGSFLRGVLDKVGVEPQVRRIGKYKSAGDQLLRRDMSEPQREQLSAILDDVFTTFTQTVAQSRNKSVEEVEAMLDAGIIDVKEYVEQGWVTALRYEDEIVADLEKRTDSKEGKLKKVGMRKYARLSPSTFGLVGKKVIAVIRTSGAISGAGGGNPLQSAGITANEVIRLLQRVKRDKSVVAVVLRVDSPGGEATASDLMWREIQVLAKKKPVVASMGDVAASGGYYMACGAPKIVAEPLTITGSIGVVAGKFNLQDLYGRVGFAKEVISRGKYAEILGESRAFTPEESELFDRSAQNSYEDFRNKAAESRGMSQDAMQERAQGRVWTGKAALEQGLVDALGGLSRAVAIAKQLAGIEQDEKVRLREVVTAASPVKALTGATAYARAFLQVVQLLSTSGAGLISAQSIGEAVITAAAQGSLKAGGRSSTVMAVMDDIQVTGASEL